MALISDHIEPDTRERILVVAERLFREIGYQKTTVADIAKVLRMSPANVYRFFDSKKAIHEGVARVLMGEVEVEAQRIADSPGPAAPRLRELMKTVHRMNSERYVGDSKLHEMVAIAMEEDWEVCTAHIMLITQTMGSVIAQGVATGEFGVKDLRDGVVLLHRHAPVLPSADDRAMRQQAGPDIDQMIDFLLAGMAPRSKAARWRPLSLPANGSRECAPDDKLREAIQLVT